MEERLEGVASPPTATGAAEEQMLRADLVREMVARRERGESTKRIARELAVDRKTVQALAADRRLATAARRRAAPRDRSVSPSSSSSAGRRWAGTAWCCIGNWWRWDSAGAISRCSAC